MICTHSPPSQFSLRSPWSYTSPIKTFSVVSRHDLRWTILFITTTQTSQAGTIFSFHSASMSSIINMLWLYCAAVGRGRLRGHMHTSMIASCNALMHFRALTSIKKDKRQLSWAGQAKHIAYSRNLYNRHELC